LAISSNPTRGNVKDDSIHLAFSGAYNPSLMISIDVVIISILFYLIIESLKYYVTV